MTLPTGFDSNFDYFKQTVEFLSQYSWIYQEANTCFVKANILEKMPMEFQEYFQNISLEDLNQFPQVQQPMANQNLPFSIKEFRQQLSALIPAEAFLEPFSWEKSKDIKMENFKKMNLKKRHEIQRLASLIQKQLKELPKCVLIDFGCGLGYLSEMLYKLNENFLIVGLESDTYRVETAQQRLKSYLPKAQHSIRYFEEYITERSKDFIIKCVEELLPNSNEQKVDEVPKTEAHMAIIGLHACADLTITSIKLFLAMPYVRQLIIMPCCYHKMELCPKTLQFTNFPLSRCLKELVAKDKNYVNFLNRPFLRLACQQTLKRWQKCSRDEHTLHGREMFLRALADALANKDSQVVIKSKQKFEMPSSLKECDFDRFSRLYHLQSNVDAAAVRVEWSDEQRKEFHTILQRYPNGDMLAEGLTCLQTSMQKLCENIVLYDRLCYMQETALLLNIKLNVRYEKLMDEELSPRCYALIAEKT
ncbi:methyltransferase-like protein 25B isoform X1 [Stomoxys calcitrans]|uniref:methyltransferase-like protein 25B isoform X1 n=2 Tax=Stomoxys calcitrans TaxID=35570 RepID=UPI0027E375E7|nr:methyltransferase-like protein 25B isoform X1 [Stomoxys calcitrans]